ncbi:related to tRNA-specific adenosine deaminase subunit TAD3 [Saccharomycodes ludwigii]|uniref:Related to tRNA-specific adenosine deaminase subunit TAD3 n=1 Tax=Saccharomycodes ludwigii TaxID=36035 RepID=A0A376B2U9_9ASCO|nr:related to tRNA-specific adenosine deaminase subunit TAD3 [Saccharomycodes ludwigii]
MVKKINNPVKIDYVNCIVEDTLKQIKPSLLTTFSDSNSNDNCNNGLDENQKPLNFIKCLLIQIKSTDTPKFLKFIKEYCSADILSRMPHIKRIKKINKQDLLLLLCSLDFLPNILEFEEFLSKKNLHLAYNKPRNDCNSTLEYIDIPEIYPPSKDICSCWSEIYWPMTWRGNPNDQILNDMEYNMTEIKNNLQLICEKSNMKFKEEEEAKVSSKALPVVTLFVNKKTGEAILSTDERHKSRPIDHSIMCGIRDVCAQLSEDGYLCLDYEVYTTHEPCSMCCMALIHSRISRLFYLKDMPKTGCLKNNYHMHSIKPLNSSYHVFQWVNEKIPLAVPNIDPDVCV